MTAHPEFTEHLLAVADGRIYARDYAGQDPAFVLMHGFPDNLHIYDDLVPHLVAAGRRVVTFDFLGFGASEKPAGAAYSFEQQMGDLETVITALRLGAVVPVAHDSSGATAINFALAHPDRVASLVILNSIYDDAFPIVWPELVELFATKQLRALAMAMAQEPAQFGWLLGWQQAQFKNALPEAQRAKFADVMGPVIANNFLQSPGAGPAFATLAAHFHAELARNTKKLAQLASLPMPVKVIWGSFDPYIVEAVGRNRASHFRQASFRALPAGHWLQSDMPAEVAQEMLR